MVKNQLCDVAKSRIDLVKKIRHNIRLIAAKLLGFETNIRLLFQLSTVTIFHPNMPNKTLKVKKQIAEYSNWTLTPDTR